MYNVKYEHRVEKDLKTLPKDIIKLALNVVETALKNKPFTGKKIEYKGKNLYRYRIRNYRIVYTIDSKSKEVIIFRIRHRKEVYRRL